MVLTDTKEQAECYALRARENLPTDYSNKKKNAAQRHRFETVDIDQDTVINNEDKIAVQNEIYQKMQQINGMFFDLNENEIDQIQELMEFEYAEESDDDVRSGIGFDYDEETYVNNGGSNSNTIDDNENAQEIQATTDASDFNVINDNENDQENLVTTGNFIETTIDETENDQEIQATPDDFNDTENSFEWSSGTVIFPLPRNSKINFEDFEQTYVNSGSNGSDNAVSSSMNFNDNGETYVSNGDTNSETVGDKENNQGIQITTGTSNTSTVDSFENATMNLHEMKNESVTVPLNIPFFSPPTTSLAFQVPKHFAKLDPNLHTLLTNKTATVASKPQMSQNDILETAKLIFPGTFVYVS